MLLTSDDSNILAWKEKRLIFQKSPLNSVAKNLEAYFKIDIEIMNEDIGRCRFTGSFDQPTLEEIIEALSVSLDLTIVKKDDTYVVDGNGC
jgi:ferric-dicitrate binding protein FerR (iron transport regulator)